MKNAIRVICACLSFFIINSCGIESYRTFEMSSSDDKIISNENFYCTFGQVIYDFDSPDIYLNFTPASDNEIEILRCEGEVSWKQNKTITPSPLKLSSSRVSIFHDKELDFDSTFRQGSIITEKFRKISGTKNSVQFNLQFNNTLPETIPKNVDKIYFDLSVEVLVNGKTEVYKPSIEVDSKSHHYVWFIRDC